MSLSQNIDFRQALEILNPSLDQRYAAITPRTDKDLDNIIHHFTNYVKPTSQMVKNMDPQDVADKMDLLVQATYELAVTARKRKERWF